MRRRVFMCLITLVSACDMLANITSAFGYPRNGDLLCPIQSFGNQFFYKASWCWSVIMSFQIYSQTVWHQLSLNWLTMNLICWLVPLATTLLPLSTDEYGRDDDYSPMYWCFIVGPNQFVWAVATFTSLLFLCTALMVYFSVYVHIVLSSMQSDVFARKALQSLTVYPICMIGVWLLSLVVLVLHHAGAIRYTSPHAYAAASLSSIVATQNGTFLAIFFFYSCPPARAGWVQLVKAWLCCCRLHAEAGSEAAAIVSFSDDVIYGDLFSSSPSSPANSVEKVLSSDNLKNIRLHGDLDIIIVTEASDELNVDPTSRTTSGARLSTVSSSGYDTAAGRSVPAAGGRSLIFNETDEICAPFHAI